MASQRVLRVVLLLGWLMISKVFAVPVDSKYGPEINTVQATCQKPLVRKEWRNLSVTERSNYIRAVKCMMAKPSITSKTLLPGVTNYYEDFLGTHILKMQNIHFVGIFFPWHRWFVHLWEQELQTCGYQGGQPYWDWTLDAVPGGLEKSPVFDPITGFGGNGAFVPFNFTNPFPGFPGPPVFGPTPTSPPGNGSVPGSNSTSTPTFPPGFGPPPGFGTPPGSNSSSMPLPPFGLPPGAAPPPGGFPPMFNMSSHTGGGCIMKGPFANLTVHMGPQWNVASTSRCVTRDFQESSIIGMGNQQMVDMIMNQTTYDTMHEMSEWSVHGAGHGGVGGMSGDMMDAWSSPSDPVFYLHHANMDRVWWSWQARNLSTRLTDISGPLFMMDFGNTMGNATLNTTLDFVSIAPSVTVQDSMDIRGGSLCYTYDTVY